MCLDFPLRRIAIETVINSRDFPSHVPLDGQIFGGDGIEDRIQFRSDRLFITGTDFLQISRHRKCALA